MGTLLFAPAPPRRAHSSSAVPFSVLVTLFYRVAVLYAATRIVLNLKRQTGGYGREEEERRRLSEEEPVSATGSVRVDLSGD